VLQRIGSLNRLRDGLLSGDDKGLRGGLRSLCDQLRTAVREFIAIRVTGPPDAAARDMVSFEEEFSRFRALNADIAAAVLSSPGPQPSTPEARRRTDEAIGALVLQRNAHADRALAACTRTLSALERTRSALADHAKRLTIAYERIAALQTAVRPLSPPKSSEVKCEVKASVEALCSRPIPAIDEKSAALSQLSDRWREWHRLYVQTASYSRAVVPDSPFGPHSDSLLASAQSLQQFECDLNRVLSASVTQPRSAAPLFRAQIMFRVRRRPRHCWR
jgi:hypothetical protein